MARSRSPHDRVRLRRAGVPRINHGCAGRTPGRAYQPDIVVRECPHRAHFEHASPWEAGHESGAAVLERVGPENSTLCRTFSDVGGRRAAILAVNGEYVRSLDLARNTARSFGD